MLTSNRSARIRPTAPCNTCSARHYVKVRRQLPKAAYPTDQRGWTRPPARAPPSRCLRSSTRAAGRGRPLITRKWSSGYQIIEQRAYAYAALTEDCERAVDEAGGAEVKLRDAPVSHSVICLGLHGHALSRRSARWPRRCRARRLPHRSAHYVATTAGDQGQPAGVPGCRPSMTGTARPGEVRPQRMSGSDERAAIPGSET